MVVLPRTRSQHRKPDQPTIQCDSDTPPSDIDMTADESETDDSSDDDGNDEPYDYQYALTLGERVPALQRQLQPPPVDPVSPAISLLSDTDLAASSVSDDHVMEPCGASANANVHINNQSSQPASIAATVSASAAQRNGWPAQPRHNGMHSQAKCRRLSRSEPYSTSKVQNYNRGNGYASAPRLPPPMLYSPYGPQAQSMLPYPAPPCPVPSYPPPAPPMHPYSGVQMFPLYTASAQPYPLQPHPSYHAPAPSMQLYPMPPHPSYYAPAPSITPFPSYSNGTASSSGIPPIPPPPPIQPAAPNHDPRELNAYRRMVLLLINAALPSLSNDYIAGIHDFLSNIRRAVVRGLALNNTNPIKLKEHVADAKKNVTKLKNYLKSFDCENPAFKILTDLKKAYNDGVAE